MTEIVASQGFGLTAPSSRQDIVSALLSAYGNSFEHDDTSLSTFSPVSADKELPPPPPRSDSLRNKPLPAVQRAEQRMSMKFQLRVIEDAPLSPNETRADSPERRSRKRILYRSLSRGAKPPLLNLVTSNGSTAIVPPTPALPVRLQTAPFRSGFDTKDLPSTPPPPPEKSERRSNAQQTRMGLQQSKAQRDLTRNDSLVSQGETKPVEPERPATVDVASVVKRKTLPVPVAKKFKSLAELGTGPRGGKGGPLPSTSAPSKQSVDSQSSRTSQQEVTQPTEQDFEVQREEQQRDLPTLNQLPPTPDEDKSTIVALVPSHKALTANGLPSNPRARGGPTTPKHIRGKSSTGFSLLKAQRPAPPIPSKQVETLTPEMTPSPTLKPEVPIEQEMSPLSPLPEQRRPFSYECVQAPEPPVTAEEQQAELPAPIIEAQGPLQPAQIRLPTRTTSLDQPSSAPAPVPNLEPETNAAAPSPSLTATPPPFTPLTRAPIPLPAFFIPAITPTHLHCYTAHKSNVWSNNTFQPMGCMICHANERDRKWSCTWCQLRVCVSCSEELRMVPGRNLGVLLQERQRDGRDGENEKEGPRVVVSGADGYEDDFAQGREDMSASKGEDVGWRIG